MIKKIAILFILFFSVCTHSKAQSMSSSNLLNNLEPFWLFIESLRKNLKESTASTYTSLLEQSYTFINLELNDKEGQLFLQLTYQIQPKNKLSLYSFYCEDKNIETQLKSKVNQFQGNFKWESNPESKFDFTPKIIQYLEIADRIASLGNDIYGSPSYYGKLILSSNFIKLEQINRRYSKSLNHKDSYFLRDLYFVIPLKENNAEKNSSKFGSYYLENMEVYFQDHSAKSRRGTGDKIKMQLNEEIKNFKTKD